MPMKQIKWMSVQDDPQVGCIPGAITLYEDMREPVLRRILESCPHMRAVHLLRRPSSVVVSNYVYTKHLYAGQELKQDVRRGEQYRNMSLERGVKAECRTYYRSYFNQSMEVHQYIQQHRTEQVLEVQYEQFKLDYDNTTRAILEHLLGRHHPSIDKLVIAARAQDVSRWPESRVAANKHISSVTAEAAVRQKVRDLLEVGDPCFGKLKHDDAVMGYSDERSKFAANFRHVM